ncbi:MAG TPA: hypothetical protein VL461_09155 [Dictyobacter sp.]|nr:hypothetical protein [Dictyobacter sp.]
MRGLVIVCLVSLLLSVTFFISVPEATNASNCVNPLSSISSSSSPTAQPQPVQGLIFINEVLSNPHSIWNCTDHTGNFSLNTWIELYNPQNQNIDLYAEHALLDEGSGSTNLYYLPLGSIIPAHGYLILFPCPQTCFPQANSTILRLNVNGVIVDQTTIPYLASDTSYARIPDGSSSWKVTTTPTIQSSNKLPAIATPTPTIHKTAKPPVKSTAKVATPRSISGSTSSKSKISTPTIPAQQPTWNALRFPTQPSPSPKQNQQNTYLNSNDPPPPTSHTTTNILSQIILTIMIITVSIGSVIFWYWKTHLRQRKE